MAALDGAPGIYSARYAGEQASDTDNIQKLLKHLADVPDDKRQAYFHCTLVYIRGVDDPCPVVCQANWLGCISRVPCGERGFGYDPVFYLPAKQCTAAELELSEKNRLSHRGQALHQLRRCLQWHLQQE